MFQIRSKSKNTELLFGEVEIVSISHSLFSQNIRKTCEHTLLYLLLLMIDTMLLLSSEILKTYEVRGSELVFLLLIRSADPADRRCDRQTDGRTDRHDKGALGLL